MTLRAMVIGTGWAGEGHTNALRAAGVEVVAMCGRTPEPAYAMAEKLGITNLCFDWRAALDEFKPEIVTLATPAGPHCEMAEAAARHGCHIMCDKPLATNAAGARAMVRAVENAGVKHAYGTTSRYAPAALYTRTLLAEGIIGQVREIEYISHFTLSPMLAFHWYHRLSQGGGVLNNLFTHQLGQVLGMTSGQVEAAAGEARRLVERAPAGPVVHDCRDFWGNTVDWEEAERGEWHEVDADWAYTVMAKLAMPDGTTASALFQGSAGGVSFNPSYLAFYGSEGTLHLTGPNAPDRIQRFNPGSWEWNEIPIPQEIFESLPQVEDSVQRDWNQLFREFITDIRGEGYSGYPTFYDGLLAAEIIEIARSGKSFTPLMRGLV